MPHASTDFSTTKPEWKIPPPDGHARAVGGAVIRAEFQPRPRARRAGARSVEAEFHVLKARCGGLDIEGGAAGPDPPRVAVRWNLIVTYENQDLLEGALAPCG